MRIKVIIYIGKASLHMLMTLITENNMRFKEIFHSLLKVQCIVSKAEVVEKF